MKNLMKIMLGLVLLAMCMPSMATDVKREQRSVWMSAYVSDWPSGKITETNAATMKKACQKMLDTLANNNMNCVYYHVRAMCDAMYNSAYEPWSSYIVETRGDVPAFDPLEWIVQEAHKRGIEIYAWVNPYRYAPSGSSWGQSELDYIHTHPEWLMTTSYETTLNPGIPEVRQRVVDVCKDIVSKYDVDGLVFDDYFYPQGGSAFTLDSVQYNAYKRAGGTMAQGDWRRENVNQMVADVQSAVKALKPWVRFGIGPAGVACSSAAVAAKYGIDPSPGSDWQYNQIYSDPIAWMSRGTIDFMSPQVYWNTNGNYDEVTTWWGKMSKHFNRHVYISQTCSSFGDTGWGLDEFVNQVKIMRETNLSGNFGMVYFKYATWRNNSTSVDGKTVALRHYLKNNVYTTPAISPVPQWEKPTQTYTAVTNFKHSGDTLSWDSIPNVRYVVYAIPDSVSDADFNCQAKYMLGFTYPCTYAIKKAYQSGYRFAVSILDRWENEYAPVMEGATAKQAEKPVIISPANGASVPMLAQLKWTNVGNSYSVQIYKDAEMQNLLANVTTQDSVFAISEIPDIETGTYYWRVTARGINLYDNTSDLQSFTCEKMRISAPTTGATNVSLTPTFTWLQGGDGTEYTLEISSKSTMATPEFTIKTADASYTMPEYKLGGGTTYYARVTATFDGASDVSDVVNFTTQNVVPAAPVFITPAADSLTLYGTNVISVKPEAGIQSLRLEICSGTSFSTRTTWKGTYEEGVFTSEALKDMTGSYKPADGKNYYLRARYAYTLDGSTTVNYTDYTPVRYFHYQATLPGDVNGDGKVDTTDLSALIAIILNNGTATDNPNADINGDGQVNSTDISALMNIILGV